MANSLPGDTAGPASVSKIAPAIQLGNCNLPASSPQPGADRRLQSGEKFRTCLMSRAGIEPATPLLKEPPGQKRHDEN